MAESATFWQRAAEWTFGVGGAVPPAAPVEAASRSGAPIQNNMPLSGIGPSSGSFWEMFTGTAGVDGQLPPMSPASVASVTAVHACTSLISGAIAALPINCYSRLPNGEREQVYNDPLWWTLNEEFNPRWSAATGWQYAMLSQLLHGDGFVNIERGRGGAIIGLRPAHPRMTEVRTSGDGRRLVYRIDYDWNDGADMIGQRVFDQDDVLHFAGIGFDGLRSMSPLRSFLRMSAPISNALQEYTGRFFSQGARPDYVIEMEGDPTDEQTTQLREQVDANHGGLVNARRPMLLSGGAKVHTISLPLEDVQLLSLRQFQIEEIARAYLVPPFMIGHNEKTTSWGSGVEAMGVGFVRYTLRNYLNGIETELNRKLYPGRRDRFLAFDTSELERADTKSLFEAFRIAMGRAGEPGFMTADEVRQRLNLRRTPGGDVLATGQKGTETNAPAA